LSVENSGLNPGSKWQITWRAFRSFYSGTDRKELAPAEGLRAAVGIAIPLAIAITSSRRFNQLVMPTMLFFQIIPKVAIAPLFLVWFGVGPTPKILVAFLISFFPIVIDAAVGLRSMSPEMADLARSMGASRWQVFAQFRLPTSLPYLFSGLKVASTLAIAANTIPSRSTGMPGRYSPHRSQSPRPYWWR